MTGDDKLAGNKLADDKLVDYLRWTTAELHQAQARLREDEDARREPVAVIGMACRFPGGVRTPEQLWDLVDSEHDAITGFPADRGWDLDDRRDPAHAPSPYIQLGGFVEDALDFDAGFFGMSPQEALATEPQQRMLLEVTWEAIENAGIAPDRLRGTTTAVYVGATAQGYGSRLEHIPAGLLGYLGNGAAGSLVSGRVAHTLGFQGAAVSLDTGCSSALVAMHLACHALRQGECELALAGGVAVFCTPGTFAVAAGAPGLLAADGRCKPYAAASDGMVYGEGAGLLLLQPLSAAQRAGRRILGLIRGSAVNSDGASTGLSAPSGPSQQRVIRAALASARLSPSEIDAVEGHGTGTAMGDLIEAQAVLATYGQERPADQPVWLGTIKPHIGHTQSAAGVAGVVKMIMALRHGTLPATLNIDRPAPQVAWSSGAVRLLTERISWPDGPQPRRCAVSAFSTSGTNAHVILEHAPEPAGPAEPADDARGNSDSTDSDSADSDGNDSDVIVAWPLSARSPQALRAQARGLAAWVRAEPLVTPADVGWTLATTRSVFEHRAVLAGTGRDDLLAGLDALASGQPHPGLVRSDGAVDTAPGRIAFVFPGDEPADEPTENDTGAGDWLPAFTAARDELSGLLSEDPGSAAGPDRDRARSFVTQVALVRLLADFDIHPQAVVAYPAGAAAAAFTAGFLQLPQAYALAAARPAGARPAGGRSAEARPAEAKPVAPSTQLPSFGGITGERIGGAQQWDALLRPESPEPDAPDAGAGLDLPGIAACVGLGSGRDGPPDMVRTSVPGQPPTLTLARALAWLHTHGSTVTWNPLFDRRPAPRTVPLPTYPFQRRRYWLYDQTPTERPGLNAPADEQFWRAVEHQDLAALAATLGADQDMLRQALPALATWRRRRDCWYRVAWQARPDGPRRRRPGHWLIVSAPGERASAVAAALRAYGASTAIVEPTPGSSGFLGAHGQLAGALSQARAGSGGSGVTGVLSLLAVDDDQNPPGAPGTALGPTIELAGALDRDGRGVPLWVATRGAVVVGRDGPPLRPEQAQLWGLGRALALEYPGGFGGLVDLPDKLDDRTGRWLAAVLAAPDGENEVAIRADGCHVRRLVRGMPRTAAPGWQPAGTVLLTGADTELGRQTARWLAAAGFGHLLLLAAERAPDALAAELPAAGAGVPALAGVSVLTGVSVPTGVSTLTGVSALTGDLAVPGTASRIAAAVPADLPLTAVVHLGSWWDGEPGCLDADRIARDWPAEVAAMTGLCALAAEHPLSSLVVCAPVTGLLAVPGLGRQAAAHAQIGALAAQCGPAVVVGMGACDEPGGPSPAAKQLHSSGITALSPRSAGAALREAAESGPGSAVFAGIDWDRAGDWLSGRPLTADLNSDHDGEGNGNGSCC